MNKCINNFQLNLGSEGPRGLAGIQGERGLPGNMTKYLNILIVF